MKQLQGSKAAAKLFSPAAFAVALTLVCQILNASAVSNYDRDPGNVEVWKEYNDIPVAAIIDQSGNFSVRLKEPGKYTLSVSCKQKGCSSYTVSTNASDAPLQSNADGSISYEFTVGKGGLNLRGQTLSIDPPRGAGANDAPGKANQPIITKDVDNLTTQAFRGNRPLLDEPASTTVNLQQPPPNQLRAGVLPVPGDYDGDGVETRTTNPTNGRDGELPGKKHNYKGVVTLVKKMYAPSSGESDDLPGTKHKFIGTVTLVRTAPNPNSGGEMLPGKIGDPIPGVPIGLEGDPGSVKVSSKTDGKGAFDFSNLPEGKYKLKLPGLPDQSVIVGREGKVGGNLMQGSDGEMMIFDRWGNLIAAPNNGGDGELPGKKHNYKGVVTLVRGTVPNPGGEGDDLPGKKHNYIGTVTLVKGTAPTHDSGDEILPGVVTPIDGTEVGLEHDPEGVPVRPTTTGEDGAFNFNNLPEGKYKLKLPGLPDQSVIVGSERKVGGNLMKGSDGEMMIFDRWGNLIANPNNGGDKTLADQLLGKGADALKGIPVPHNDNTGGITVPPPKIGNDKPVMEGPKNSPVGFGTGMGNSPGKGPDLNSMGGMNPGMMSPPGGVGSGPVNPMSGGGPAGGPGAMSPGGPGGSGSPVSSMHP